MRKLKFFVFCLFFLVTACSPAASTGMEIGSLEEFTEFVEGDESGYVCVITGDEDYVNQVADLARKYNIWILGYNTHKPDGENEDSTVEYPYGDIISKDKLTFLEDGENVAELDVRAIEPSELEEKFRMFVETNGN